MSFDEEIKNIFIVLDFYHSNDNIFTKEIINLD